MNKLFVIILMSGAASFFACGQKLDASKVPAPVKESFSTHFPGSSAKWEKEDGQFEAGFKYQEHDMSALFEANGTILESELIIKVTELPVNIFTYIKNNYKDAGIKEAAKITKANGEMIYEAEIKGKDLLFDLNGNFIKEVKK